MEAEEGPPVAKRARTYRMCEHCSKEVSVRVYKNHRRLYFNAASNTWTKEDQELSSSELSTVDFDIESPDPPIESSPEDSGGVEWGDEGEEHTENTTNEQAQFQCRV